MNYEADIRIDETALDLEWLEQASLMLKYTREQADTMKEEELAKERLDLVKAELDKEIRTNPESFDIVKITEGAIQAAILSHNKYQRASKELIDARYNNLVAKGAVRAFEQRKDALENLARLHGQQYFAGPKVPLDITREWEKKKKQERADRSVGKMTRQK